ncbi:tRNA dihydrouridine synthase DusB [Thiomicrorhabdus sp. ZW0627]|uniref:tRNA dihydrouridine synthase DusB n=1 Tax=Thiomicrorhabdus sp. ZW0627 TaxID=3039774 RepID=UPI00243689B0|nr:tRNA dihydrouridine synthase DusB [Thiomicrorhabdus sp. ZW0627]MDG6774880.1 tRNA dihydrouridine synthase DusB [Thiomicrorhabdus sp. ZW0627]
MLNIGPYTFAHNLVLAPMAGVTDAVYRKICRTYGADYTLSEMVASQKQLWESKKSSTRQADRNDPEPRAVQLLGTNPQELADAAIWQQQQGAQIIDLNMGCPAKKVCSVAAGSALMGAPDLAADIFKAVVDAVDVPVTVKIRTGLDAENKNALEIALLAQEKGLQAVTIHGRTREDKFNGQAEYNTIRAVKQQLEIPVIANGDINTPEQAKFVLEYTSADGLMIGRASQGYPWIFREINHYLATGNTLPPPTLEEFHTTIMEHTRGLHQLYGEMLGVRIARKHIGWYSQHLKEGVTLRKSFNQLTDPLQQLKLIDRFFEAAVNNP